MGNPNSRPGQWELLGEDSDPLPGNPDDVRSDQTHYRSIANQIDAQVARLQQMASGSNELVGKYAPKLKEAAEDLRGDLEKTHGRFTTVADQLAIWLPVLTDGRTATARHLKRAETAHSTMVANKPPDSPPDPDDEDATTKETARKKHYGTASSDLAAAKRDYDNYMVDVRSTGNSVAKKISDASHDKLKSHRFDGLRKWVHDHADLLKKIASVLTWIATALVVVALFATGIGELLTVLAIAATAGALLIHTVLAANGDGSWTDVAIDVVCLLTMGAGKILTSGAKLARTAQLSESSMTFADSAFNAAVKNGRLFMVGSDGVAEALTPGRAFAEVASSIWTREMPEASRLARLFQGDSLEVLRDLRTMRATFGNTPLIEQGLRAASLARTNYWVGSTVDVLSKAVMSTPEFHLDVGEVHLDFHWDGIPAVNDWAEEHTVGAAPDFVWDYGPLASPISTLIH